MGVRVIFELWHVVLPNRVGFYDHFVGDRVPTQAEGTGAEVLFKRDLQRVDIFWACIFEQVGDLRVSDCDLVQEFPDFLGQHFRLFLFDRDRYEAGRVSGLQKKGAFAGLPHRAHDESSRRIKQVYVSRHQR